MSSNNLDREEDQTSENVADSDERLRNEVDKIYWKAVLDNRDPLRLSGEDYDAMIGRTLGEEEQKTIQESVGIKSSEYQSLKARLEENLQQIKHNEWTKEHYAGACDNWKNKLSEVGNPVEVINDINTTVEALNDYNTSSFKEAIDNDFGQLYQKSYAPLNEKVTKAWTSLDPAGMHEAVDKKRELETDIVQDFKAYQDLQKLLSDKSQWERTAKSDQKWLFFGRDGYNVFLSKVRGDTFLEKRGIKFSRTMNDQNTRSGLWELMTDNSFMNYYNESKQVFLNLEAKNIQSHSSPPTLDLRGNQITIDDFSRALFKADFWKNLNSEALETIPELATIYQAQLQSLFDQWVLLRQGSLKEQLDKAKKDIDNLSAVEIDESKDLSFEQYKKLWLHDRNLPLFSNVAQNYLEKKIQKSYTEWLKKRDKYKDSYRRISAEMNKAAQQLPKGRFNTKNQWLAAQKSQLKNWHGMINNQDWDFLFKNKFLPLSDKLYQHQQDALQKSSMQAVQQIKWSQFKTAEEAMMGLEKALPIENIASEDWAQLRKIFLLSPLQKNLEKNIKFVSNNIAEAINTLKRSDFSSDEHFVSAARSKIASIARQKLIPDQSWDQIMTKNFYPAIAEKNKNLAKESISKIKTTIASVLKAPPTGKHNRRQDVLVACRSQLSPVCGMVSDKQWDQLMREEFYPGFQKKYQERQNLVLTTMIKVATAAKPEQIASDLARKNFKASLQEVHGLIANEDWDSFLQTVFWPLAEKAAFQKPGSNNLPTEKEKPNKDDIDHSLDNFPADNLATAVLGGVRNKAQFEKTMLLTIQLPAELTATQKQAKLGQLKDRLSLWWQEKSKKVHTKGKEFLQTASIKASVKKMASFDYDKTRLRSAVWHWLQPPTRLPADMFDSLKPDVESYLSQVMSELKSQQKQAMEVISKQEYPKNLPKKPIYQDLHSFHQALSDWPIEDHLWPLVKEPAMTKIKQWHQRYLATNESLDDAANPKIEIPNEIEGWGINTQVLQKEPKWQKESYRNTALQRMNLFLHNSDLGLSTLPIDYKRQYGGLLLAMLPALGVTGTSVIISKLRDRQRLPDGKENFLQTLYIIGQGIGEIDARKYLPTTMAYYSQNFSQSFGVPLSSIFSAELGQRWQAPENKEVADEGGDAIVSQPNDEKDIDKSISMTNEQDLDSLDQENQIHSGQFTQSSAQNDDQIVPPLTDNNQPPEINDLSSIDLETKEDLPAELLETEDSLDSDEVDTENELITEEQIDAIMEDDLSTEETEEAQDDESLEAELIDAEVAMETEGLAKDEPIDETADTIDEEKADLPADKEVDPLPTAWSEIWKEMAIEEEKDSADKQEEEWQQNLYQQWREKQQATENISQEITDLLAAYPQLKNCSPSLLLHLWHLHGDKSMVLRHLLALNLQNFYKDNPSQINDFTAKFSERYIPKHCKLGELIMHLTQYLQATSTEIVRSSWGDISGWQLNKIVRDPDKVLVDFVSHYHRETALQADDMRIEWASADGEEVLYYTIFMSGSQTQGALDCALWSSVA